MNYDCFYMKKIIIYTFLSLIILIFAGTMVVYNSIIHIQLSHGASIIENKKFPCVTLQLPHTIEEYNKMLSKNSRQNLRTANNRLQKDGKTLIFNDDDQQVDRQECMRLREAKLSVKYADFSLYWKYKYRIIHRLQYRFSSFNPLTHFSHSKVMTAHDENGVLRAFSIMAMTQVAKLLGLWLLAPI